MTIKELSQLYNLNREIEQNKRRLSELTASATDTSVKVSGLPHIHGVSNKTAIAAEIADLEASISARIQLSIVEYNRLNRYINNIEDCLVRQIISLRFINGLKWRDVAQNIGGNNSEESIKKVFMRYIKSCPECPE